MRLSGRLLSPTVDHVRLLPPCSRLDIHDIHAAAQSLLCPRSIVATPSIKMPEQGMMGHVVTKILQLRGRTEAGLFSSKIGSYWEIQELTYDVG